MSTTLCVLVLAAVDVVLSVLGHSNTPAPLGPCDSCDSVARVAPAPPAALSPHGAARPRRTSRWKSRAPPGSVSARMPGAGSGPRHRIASRESIPLLTTVTYRKADAHRSHVTRRGGSACGAWRGYSAAGSPVRSVDTRAGVHPCACSCAPSGC